MVNKNLFASLLNRLRPAEIVNEAGGRAYRLTPKHALAQLAATGCFNGTYYAEADDQLATLLDLTAQVDDNAFLAKLAVYSRERAFLKDMPAALLLVLSQRDVELFGKVFDRVVDNGRVLRTFVRMLRSGQFGRKSLSYALQRAVNRWLNSASVGTLLAASIGNDPSLRDVLRLARPTPRDNTRRALFGWLAGKDCTAWAPAALTDLPAEISDLIELRLAETEARQVEVLGRSRFRFDLIADSIRGPAVWKAVARQMGPQALRMNLNTLLRHEVFDDPALVVDVAERLADADEVRRSRQFPYQFLAAYLNVEASVPVAIREALGKAAELACGNVPELPGPVVIGLDVSGSMASAVTGRRGRGATSKMRCVDVAALFAAAVLRRNPGSVVVPFDTQAYAVEVPADEPILALADRLAKYGGGGTNCSLPLQFANRNFRDRPFVGCVLVSDMESWIGAGQDGLTGVAGEWRKFVEQRPWLRPDLPPKLVCINVQPYTTAQAPERDDVLNVAGFSDAVFDVTASFLRGDAERFVAEVEAIEL